MVLYSTTYVRTTACPQTKLQAGILDKEEGATPGDTSMERPRRDLSNATTFAVRARPGVDKIASEISPHGQLFVKQTWHRSLVLRYEKWQLLRTAYLVRHRAKLQAGFLGNGGPATAERCVYGKAAIRPFQRHHFRCVHRPWCRENRSGVSLHGQRL